MKKILAIIMAIFITPAYICHADVTEIATEENNVDSDYTTNPEQVSESEPQNVDIDLQNLDPAVSDAMKSMQADIDAGNYEIPEINENSDRLSGIFGYTDGQTELVAMSYIPDSLKEYYSNTQIPIKRTGTNMDLIQAASDTALATSMNSSMQLSDAINDMFGATISKVSRVDDISDLSLSAGVDFGVLNMQYEMATGALYNGWQENAEQAGKAENAISIFQNAYGDLANNLTLPTPEIPEGFNPNEMMQSASMALNSQYSTVTNSGQFATIKQVAGLGRSFEIFNKVDADISKGSGVSSSMLTQDLNALLSTYSDSIGGRIQSEYSSNYSANRTAYGRAKQTYNNLVKNSFELQMLNSDGSYNAQGIANMGNQALGYVLTSSLYAGRNQRLQDFENSRYQAGRTVLANGIKGFFSNTGSIIKSNLTTDKEKQANNVATAIVNSYNKAANKKGNQSNTWTPSAFDKAKIVLNASAHMPGVIPMLMSGYSFKEVITGKASKDIMQRATTPESLKAAQEAYDQKQEAEIDAKYSDWLSTQQAQTNSGG